MKIGDSVQPMIHTSLDGKIVSIGGKREGRSQLVFFVSPDCPVCKSLLPVFKSAARAERAWLDAVLASDGDEAVQRRMIMEQDLSGFPFVLSEALGRSFGVSKLPYAVLIDEGGHIASLGLVNSREHLESLVFSRGERVASIPD
ncbi:MAG: redoxin family protein [Sphingomonadaceae bacterium]